LPVPAKLLQSQDWTSNGWIFVGTHFIHNNEYPARKVLPQLQFEIPFCYRFVDDLLLSIPKDKIDTILEIFNGYSGWIKFTVEIEKDGVP
jgi:hypothetical protein